METFPFHLTLGQNFFPAEFQLFLSLVSLLTYSPGSALHMRFIYSLQIWWYVWASKSTSAVVFARHKRRESQIETNPCSALTLHAWFHIP